MIRTLVGIAVIFISILWLPLWLQLGLFLCGVIVLSYRLILLIPALMADALYAPGTGFELGHFKMTMIVGGLLLLWFIITTQTRIGHHYAFTKK